MLEHSITFFREECIKMAASIDSLKKKTKKQATQLKFANSETEAWLEEAKTLKYQNILLRSTVNQLKSP